MKITQRQLRRIIKEELDRVDPYERPGEDKFDYVMRKAIAVLGPDVELGEEQDGEIKIIEPYELIQQKIGDLTEMFPDGANSEDGFLTGFLQ